MDIIQHQILVMAKSGQKKAIKKISEDIADITIFEADSENRAFELICSNIFMLAIVDPSAQFDIYKIGTMLLSHRKTHKTPLLIITQTIKPENFLSDFQDLHIDYIQKPFNEQLLLAKIKIFMKLFEHKKAVEQSLDELNNLYKNIFSQHELYMKEEESKRELTNISSIAVNQMQQPMQNIQGNIYQLLHTEGLSRKNRSNIVSIKTAAEHLMTISKKLGAIPLKREQILTKIALDLNSNKKYQILYAENHDEDYQIFKHTIINTVKCRLIQAKNIRESMECIADSKYDLIFITHSFSDGSGLELISRLNRLCLDIPLIFIVKKKSLHLGTASIAKGATAFLAKEDISRKTLFSTIEYSLKKVRLTADMEEAKNRIILISNKDNLTRLYNRKYFEQQIKSETSRAKRHKTGLSILMLDIDKFKIINQNHGYETGDLILATAAALIQSMVRDSDKVCRYSGEEFSIILPDTDLNGARILAEKIRKKIAGHLFSRDHDVLKLTVSIGIAAYDLNRDTTYGHFIKRGLDAMASASAGGGSRTETLVH